MDRSSLRRHVAWASLTAALLGVLASSGGCVVHAKSAQASDPAGATPAPGAGCASDKDCKGDRVCESGRCVAGSSAPQHPDQPPAVQPAKPATPPLGVPTLSDGDG
jgi:hypothetical protein